MVQRCQGQPSTCAIAFFRPACASETIFDHYSLLKTTEQLLGLTTFLGHAADPGTTSMAPAFDLG